MRENRLYGSEGGGIELNRSSLPLFPIGAAWRRRGHRDKLGGGQWGVAIVVYCETCLRRDELGGGRMWVTLRLPIRPTANSARD